MRLIEAYPIEARIIQYLNKNAHINDTAEDALKMALRWLVEAPAIRTKGKWKFIDGEWSDYECSECGEQVTCQSPYCPNCGARMETEE